MKRKKKGMSNLTRVLLCSWCVLMLVLTFFVIKWALSLPDANDMGNEGNVDAFLEVTSGVKPTEPVNPEDELVTVTPEPTPTPVPQAEFVKEYPHMGTMTESYDYTEGVAYGLRYPCYEEEAVAGAVLEAANQLVAEEIAELAKKEGNERILLIDYEDGETAGLVSVLFRVETEIDGVKESTTKKWLYNKKKAEPTEADALFADLAYKYVAQQVNGLLKEAETNQEDSLDQPEDMFVGTREEFSDYVLTADGAKFYYEVGGERQSIVIPYIEIHTYMAVTESGNVVAERIRELDPNKPMIALTFDDGPHYNQTPRLLEILEKNGARATFFVLGDRVLWGPSNEKALNMVYESGNEVASHTYSHKDLKTLSAEKITEEIVKTRDAIYSVIGEYPTLVRPPYGGYDDEVKAYSYAPLITWNLDSKDWSFRDTEKIVEHVLAEAGNGKIVLMHDIHWFTVDAAEILIPELISRGYQIVTVQELFYYNNVEPENGVVYHSSYN